MCVSELRGLGAVQDELARRGGTILSVSVDPPERSRRVVEKNGLKFPILADQQGEVMRAFGVLHPHGSPEGADVAIPSMFLIDRDRKIAWSRVAKYIQDRPDPDDVLATVRRTLGP